MLSSRINDDTFRIGVPFLILGESVRFWSLGYMEKKGSKLTVSGPYAFVRNPLYWGNFLLGLGVVLACDVVWAYFAFIAGFIFVYGCTVKAEEKTLRDLFGFSYSEYFTNVPRFFPRLTPWVSSMSDHFELRRIWKHHEYITVIGVVILIFGLYLHKKIFLEHDDFDVKQKWAVLAIVICALTLIFERIFRKQIRSN